MNRATTFGLPISSRYSFASKQKLRLESFWILSFAAIIILLGFCAFQVIKQSAVSYFVKNCEKRITELSRENKELQILVSQENSLEGLEKTAEHFKFEPIARVHYIKILEGAVAKQ